MSSGVEEDLSIFLMMKHILNKSMKKYLLLINIHTNVQNKKRQEVQIQYDDNPSLFYY